MPKYLLQASYTQEGLRSVIKDGGTGRRKVVQEALKSINGKLESIYFAFGPTDVFVTVDVPDHASAAAIALAVGASGIAAVNTAVLFTPEEMDAAAKKSITYRPASKAGK